MRVTIEYDDDEIPLAHWVIPYIAVRIGTGKEDKKKYERKVTLSNIYYINWSRADELC